MKWKIRQDAFATITQNAPRVSGPNAPDIMRLPQVSGLVKDHLLKNLDGYFKAFGWNKFPASQLAQVRMPAPVARVVAGSLWAFGLNYSLTGVFYNKTLAAKVGMTSAPTTLAQLDALLAKAKAAGVTPIVQFNGGATGGLLFPLQQLMAIYGSPAPINNWIFQKAGANIDTASNLAAATHLDGWIKAGYFNSDANATDYPTMMSKFQHDDGLLMFDGDWESGNLDKLMPGKVGFFLMPTLKAGGQHTAMSAPLTYGIAAKAKHADCAAFFFNWVATNPAARKVNVSVGGSNPGGPPSLPIPVPKKGIADRADARGGQGRRRTERRDGLHRQRDGRDLRAVLDARGAEAVRRPGDAGRRPQEGAVGLRAAGQERGLMHDRPLNVPDGSASTGRDTSRARGVADVADSEGQSPRRSVQGWLFVAPALTAYAVFVLWPLIQTFKYSLYSWDGIAPARWVGLANFKTVFTDHDLLAVLEHAFELIIFFSAIPVVLGLVVATVMRRIASRADQRRRPRRCCSCRRSCRWSRPVSPGAGCCRRPVWSTRC